MDVPKKSKRLIMDVPKKYHIDETRMIERRNHQATKSSQEYLRQIYFVISRSGAFCTAFMKRHTEKNIL
jgi:hypothetical protein